MEHKKTGRPTVAPKNNQYRIRLTDAELKMLDEACAKTGLSKADVFRLGIKKVLEQT